MAALLRLSARRMTMVHPTCYAAIRPQARVRR